MNWRPKRLPAGCTTALIKHGRCDRTLGIIVHPTLKSLRSFSGATRAVGQFRPKLRSKLIFGEIHLARTWLTTEVVIHECIHAAHTFAYVNPELKWPNCENNEEEFVAYPGGDFAARLLAWLRERFPHHLKP